MNLKWTKKKPTDEGWYWLNQDGHILVVEVYYDGDGVLHSQAFVSIMPVAGMRNCLWCGPIPEPTS